MGSAGRKGKGHALTWGSRSAWRASILQNRAGQLGSITWVPWNRIGHTFLFIVLSDPSTSGCQGHPVFGSVLLGRMPVVAKATRQPFAEGEGDRGEATACITLPLQSPQALTSDPRGGEHLPAGCCKTPPKDLTSWPPDGYIPPHPAVNAWCLSACKGQVSSSKSTLL